MQQHSFSLASGLLAVSLLLASCGDATETALGGDPTTTLGSTTTTSIGGTATTFPAGDRGWLEGDGLSWSGSASGYGDEELDFASAADSGGGDELRSEPVGGDIAPIPPVDNSPLQAGSIDDGDDVDAYLDYRNSITGAGVAVRPFDPSESTVFTVIGDNGLPVLDAVVEIWDNDPTADVGEPSATLRTTADGTVRFLPHEMAPGLVQAEALVRVGDVDQAVPFELGVANIDVTVDADGGIEGSVPLDVHFVLDATGSMGDEIARLRENMTTVAEQIDALPSDPDVRFGMTVYRDEGDVFVTRNFDLTDDLASFLTALDDVQADGGGDYPEALDEALADALNKPEWRRDGAVELMFVIADAPPQIDRQLDQPYTATAIAAAEAGVKIFPVAASGTDDQAEYAMRDLAFTTGGRFVFLAYGDGASATGSGTDIGSADYDELPLDQLVVRLVQDELAALTGEAPAPVPTTTVPVTTTTFDQ